MNKAGPIPDKLKGALDDYRVAVEHYLRWEPEVGGDIEAAYHQTKNALTATSSRLESLFAESRAEIERLKTYINEVQHWGLCACYEIDDLRERIAEMEKQAGQVVTVTFPPPIGYLGGCNCAFKAPTVPTCRDGMEHLADCPAKDGGYPVGAALMAKGTLHSLAVAPTQQESTK